MLELYTTIGEHIEDTGTSLMGVFPTEKDPMPFSFLYTIGHCIDGLPELIVFCGDIQSLMPVMNMLADVQRRDGAFKPGQIVDIGGDIPLKIVDANNDYSKEHYAIQVERALQSLNKWPGDFVLLQVLLPDTDGHYPDEVFCKAPYGDVPLLSVHRV